MHLHSRPQGLNAGLCLLSSIHKNPLRQGLCWLSHSLLKIITNPKSEAKRNFSILERIKTCTLNTPTECTGPALHWKPADSASLPKVRVLKGFPTGRSAVPLSPLHLSTSVGKLKCQFIVLPFVLRAASMFYVHVLYASVFWQEVHPMKLKNVLFIVSGCSLRVLDLFVLLLPTLSYLQHHYASKCPSGSIKHHKCSMVTRSVECGTQAKKQLFTLNMLTGVHDYRRGVRLPSALWYIQFLQDMSIHRRHFVAQP